jgi:hypothetical protein
MRVILAGGNNTMLLVGLLALVLAAMTTTLEVNTVPEQEPLKEEAHWYEYEGTFRGMVG